MLSPTEPAVGKGVELPALPSGALCTVLLCLDGHVPSLFAAACLNTSWRDAVFGTPAIWRSIVINPISTNPKGWFFEPRSACTVTGEQLARLVALSAGGVTRLTLNWCHNLDNEALSVLAATPLLEELSLVGCKLLTVSGVVDALAGRQLKSLSVNGILNDFNEDDEAYGKLASLLLDDEEGLDVMSVCREDVPLECDPLDGQPLDCEPLDGQPPLGFKLWILRIGMEAEVRAAGREAGGQMARSEVPFLDSLQRPCCRMTLDIED